MLKNIFKAISVAGGKPYLVGGFVRDYVIRREHCLKIESKDIDVEVFGITADKLVEVLNQFGKVDEVGKSFGVIKLTCPDGKDYDFNLPRRDSKVGSGHKDFMVTVDPNISIEEAAGRRDFTINSILADENGDIIDPYGGVGDIKSRRLHPTTDAFKEDALRVLRGFQFSARFNMYPSIGLRMDAAEMLEEYIHLSKERIWEEWKKWALKGEFYCQSLYYLNFVYWSKLYPELHGIYGVNQEPKWHPEGTVDKHTGYVLEAMHNICVRENITGEDRLVLIFSALTHDFGKATHTYVKENGEIGSKGHEAASGPLARSFLESIGCPGNIIEQVVVLVENHMLWMEMSDKHIRKVAAKLAAGKTNFKMLTYLLEADRSGRPPLEKGLTEGQIINRQRAIELGCWEDKPVAIIRGQDVVDFGYEPGPIVGKIIKKLYEMQLNGSFSDKETGLSRIKSFVASL